MADVINFSGKKVGGDFDPDQTLRELIGNLQAFVLSGYDHDGNEVVAITFGHLPEALWSLQRASKSILERPDEEL
tara:strand:+ start:648 stop:872 length:225 start_codon:yes stop_codon:yes gene_type:complete